MRRTLLLRVLSFSTLVARAEPAVRDAPAASPEDRQAQSTGSAPNPAVKGPFGGRGFGLGVAVGYGTTRDVPAGIRLRPQELMVGLRLEYVFHFGLRLGAYGDYGFGSSVEQTYHPVGFEPIPLKAKSKMQTFGVSVGFDDVLGPVVLRYALDIGISHLSWDFGDIPWRGLGGYSPMQGSSTSLHLAPGIGLLFPIYFTYLGAELRYQVQLGDNIPSGPYAFVHTGVRW